MKPCAVAAGVFDRQGGSTVAASSRSDAELATKTDLKQEFAALKADLRQENAAFEADLRQLRREITAVRSAIFWSEWRAELEAKLNAAVHKMVLGQIATAVWLFVAIKFF